MDDYGDPPYDDDYADTTALGDFACILGPLTYASPGYRSERQAGQNWIQERIQ